MATGFEFVVLGAIISMTQIYFAATYFRISSPFADEYPFLCYFGLDPSWPNNGSLHPAMNATLCTHMILIGTDIKDCQIVLPDPDCESKYMSKIPLLRKQNPSLKILISNGGGNNNGFTPVLASQENTTKFIEGTIPFLKKYGLDGLDIDWEFPGWMLPQDQRKNFTIFIQQLSKRFDSEAKSGGTRYLLSAAVAAGRSVMEIYDVPALAGALDFINLMCYDYHGYAPYDPITGYNSPLYPTTWQKQIVITSGNVGWSSYEWYKRGMPKAKIMVGIPTYAHTWTLLMPDEYHGHNAPAKGPGRECDECSYPWVCNFLNYGAAEVFDEDAYVSYCYKGDQWVSYDNARSIQMKAQWIIDNGFGGIMVFSMNDDDYNGVSCNQGNFPLLSLISNVIRNKTALRFDSDTSTLL